MKFSVISKAALFLFVAALPMASFAGVCDEGTPEFDQDACDALNGGGGPSGGGSGVPIDGGVSLLAAAGVAFAAKRFSKKNTPATPAA
jgi:hypothetical protein